MRRITATLTLLPLIASGVAAGAPEWSGYVSVEPRLFPSSQEFAEPPRGWSASAALAPEFRYAFRDGRDRVTIAPYVRFDEHDGERSHADLREAVWLHVDEPWTLRLGLSKVFWGVTESRHLVDIVNQTDSVEDIDGEDKLGQPMIELERGVKSGALSVFVLPGFRERTFPAADARLRGALPIAVARAEYESGDRDRHLDLALRWSAPLGPWDLGLSAFRGNSREPRFLPSPATAGGIELVPRYDVITQLGTDVQYTRAAWLWKGETILRRSRDDRFAAFVGGFEYTFSGLGGGSADWGLLVEYLYDGRDARSPPTIADDDVFAGFRWSRNDVAGTALLAGWIVDRDGGGTIASLEAERRLGDTWKLELEARWLGDIDPGDPYLGGFRQDSFVTVRLARYF